MTALTSRLTRVGLMFLLLTGLAAPASADWLLTPYLGITFGGNADFGDVGDFEDNFEKKVTFGGTATWMGAGIIGAEVDLGITPNFFAFTTGDADFDFGDSNVTTLMGNLVIGAPIGGTEGPGFRPYGSGGIGLLRTSIDAFDIFDELSENELGLNVGGGAYFFFSDNIGIRGDVRYFRALQGDDDDDDDDFIELDLDNFDFWRGTVGVTFRFGG
jgi:opacity protein-like surface antigen